NEATQLLCGLYRTLWPGSADLSAAAREVESTFQRHDEGHEITGLPHLMKLVSPPAVKEIAKWLKLGREAEPVRHVPPSEAAIPAWPGPLKPAGFYGIVGDVVDLVRPH